MNISIYCIGKMRFKPYRDSANEYLSRLQHYVGAREVELKSPAGSNWGEEQIKKRESEMILSALGAQTYLFAMDERGKCMNSQEFANKIQSIMMHHSQVAFAIGGAFGHDESLRRASGCVFALSPLTFPHELARVILYEQLYRAMTILKGEPYHK